MSPKRKKIIRIAVLSALGLATIGVTSVVSYDAIVQWKAEGLLKKISNKIGQPVSAEVESPYPGLVHLRQFRVGEAEALLLSVDQIEVGFSVWDAVFDKPKPEGIYISNVKVYGQSNGTLEGLYSWMKQLIPVREKTASTDSSSTGRVALPDMQVTDIRFVDKDDVFTASLPFMDLSNNEVTGNMSFGDISCDYSGSIVSLNFDCDNQMWLPVTQDHHVGLLGFNMDLEDERRLIGMQEVRIASHHPKLNELAKDYVVDLELNLNKDAQDRYPYGFKVTAVDGGSATGKGVANRTFIYVDVESDDFPIADPEYSLNLRVDGRNKFTLFPDEKKVLAELDGRLKGVVLEHPKVAEQPIGPMDLTLGGSISAELIHLEERIVTVDWQNGKLGLGEVFTDLSFYLNTTPDSREVRLKSSTPEVDASLVAAAIPNGLMPHVMPIVAEGPFKLDVHIDIKEPNFEELTFEIDLPLEDITILSMNDHIDFKKLSGGFYTEFTGPKRYTGPKSKRWVRLGSMPPVLPYIVMGQEDSRFLKHGGVRPNRIRDSVVTNLQKDGFARGGSTVTMQLSRNLFLSPRKAMSRKLEEIFISWQMELFFKKKYKSQFTAKMKMMEVYLNIVEFGPGIYGIKHASRHFFGKTPMQLNVYEMVWLIKRLPRPRFRSAPKTVSKRMAAGMNKLMSKMRRKKFIPEAFYVPMEEGPWPSQNGDWSTIDTAYMRDLVFYGKNPEPLIPVIEADSETADSPSADQKPSSEKSSSEKPTPEKPAVEEAKEGKPKD